VLVVPRRKPEEIEQYAMRVAEAWKLGREASTTAPCCSSRSRIGGVRIEVGYGLEGVLPDAVANRIIDQEIVPAFRRGDFYAASRPAWTACCASSRASRCRRPRPSPAHGVPGLFQLLPFLFVFALVGGSIFRRLLGASAAR